MQHKKILTQGGMVHYWINRKENAADCIVFTHGVTADHTMFEQQVSYFYGNYTIILWDVQCMVCPDLIRAFLIIIRLKYYVTFSGRKK